MIAHFYFYIWDQTDFVNFLKFRDSMAADLHFKNRSTSKEKNTGMSHF